MRVSGKPQTNARHPVSPCHRPSRGPCLTPRDLPRHHDQAFPSYCQKNPIILRNTLSRGESHSWVLSFRFSKSLPVTPLMVAQARNSGQRVHELKLLHRRHKPSWSQSLPATNDLAGSLSPRSWPSGLHGVLPPLTPEPTTRKSLIAADNEKAPQLQLRPISPRFYPFRRSPATRS